MIKRLLPIAAVVLVANGAALFVVARNAARRPDARVRATEREVRLMDAELDTTSVTLQLAWHEPFGPRPLAAPWLTSEKLRALGFDCSMALDAPGAARHYSYAAQPPRGAYVVLDFDREAVSEPEIPASSVPPQAAAAPAEQPTGEAFPARVERPSHLRAVDAGMDPVALRQRYPDRARFAVTRGAVRLLFRAATPAAPAFLGGSVVVVFPDQLYVPTQLQAPLRALRGQKNSEPWQPLSREPRYDVTIEYGSGFMPRVVDVRAR